MFLSLQYGMTRYPNPQILNSNGVLSLKCVEATLRALACFVYTERKQSRSIGFYLALVLRPLHSLPWKEI